ncbi:hypothetical protein ZWY2020_013961 [Hordeum vulgare]|nr:hypothetical protein ZWY2020_013961 [Hordeum vulgare]
MGAPAAVKRVRLAGLPSRPRDSLNREIRFLVATPTSSASSMSFGTTNSRPRSIARTAVLYQSARTGLHLLRRQPYQEEEELVKAPSYRRRRRWSEYLVMELHQQ